MINKWRTYNTSIFYWLLFMVAIVLSFPRYSLESKFLIGFTFYGLFLTNSFKDKKYLLYKNRYALISIIVYFLLALFGCVYSNNLEGTPKYMIQKLPFLIIPLVIFSIPLKRDTFKYTYKYFSYGVIAASLSALFKGVYFKYMNFGNYLYYHDFEVFTGKHSTYFALFLVLTFLYFFQQILTIKKYRLLHTLILVFLLFMMYIVSNRISLVSLVVGLVVYAFPLLKRSAKISFALLLITGFLLTVNTPYFKRRFSPNYLKNNKLNEFDLRVIHWRSVVETVVEENVLFGLGTEGKREKLYQKYKKYGYRDAYVFKYNAHNQFLEIFLNFGLLGLFIMLFALAYQIKMLISSKNFFLLAVYLSLLTFMLTESLLERQSGIIIFSLFVSLLLYESKCHKKENN